MMVSGRLWRDSLIMMDKETETLWSHVTGEAIRGPLAGKKLQALPMVHTTWKKWRAAYPDTRVLVKDGAVAGGSYESYAKDPDKFGLGRAKRAIKQLPGKDLVHGTVVDGEAVAITAAALEGKEQREATVSDRKIIFRRTADGGVRAFNAKSEQELPVTLSYWFAWVAFYPNTQLIK
jgi:hypothetical protein